MLISECRLPIGCARLMLDDDDAHLIASRGGGGEGNVRFRAHCCRCVCRTKGASKESALSARARRKRRLKPTIKKATAKRRRRRREGRRRAGALQWNLLARWRRFFFCCINPQAERLAAPSARARADIVVHPALSGFCEAPPQTTNERLVVGGALAYDVRARARRRS